MIVINPHVSGGLSGARRAVHVGGVCISNDFHFKPPYFDK